MSRTADGPCAGPWEGEGEGVESGVEGGSVGSPSWGNIAVTNRAIGIGGQRHQKEWSGYSRCGARAGRQGVLELCSSGPPALLDSNPLQLPLALPLLPSHFPSPSQQLPRTQAARPSSEHAAACRCVAFPRLDCPEVCHTCHHDHPHRHLTRARAVCMTRHDTARTRGLV